MPTSRSRRRSRCASRPSWTPRRSRPRSACGPHSRTSCAGAGSCSRSCRPSRCERMRSTASRSARMPSTSPGVALGRAVPDRLPHRGARARAVAAWCPRDGTDGIAPTTPIAVFFDRPIDPDSLVRRGADAHARRRRLDRARRRARRRAGRSRRRPWCCASRLPARCRPNTTFEVVLASGITGAGRRRPGRAPSRGPSPPARRRQRSRTRSRS